MLDLASAPRSDLHGFEMNTAPAGVQLPMGFVDFYAPLHTRFTPWQQELAAKRKEVLKAAHAGHLPDHLAPSVATNSDWRIELPTWALDQRNQMTGPADDAELSVKMLNSGAPGVMLDLEDSMANFWPNLERGIENILQALRGKLAYFDKKRNQEVAVKESKTVVFTRARGLHIHQRGGFGKADEVTSASLYDVCRIAYAIEPHEVKHPLCFYIPKSESAEEALWWADLFKRIAAYKGCRGI
jgi:malate synthase